MPYSTNEQLPSDVRAKYSDQCQTVFRDVWNKTFSGNGDEDQAFRYAFTAANQCEESTRMDKFAIRTVSEDKNVHVIEGLAFPFRGRDTYGTFFSARTDFHWDLFPDSEAEPQFLRPMTFQHGFDEEFGLSRQGGWTPIRTDADGVWVRAQIDKRQKYYATRIKPMLESGALGLSGGSAEHSVRIDERSGEILEWPAYELALTPTESNPLAQIAVRAEETIRIVASRAEESTADINDLPDSDFAYIEPGGKKDAEGKTTPRSLRHFPIHDAAHVRNALARASQSPFGDKAMPKIQAAAKKFGIDSERSGEDDADLEPATRAGKTISAATAAGLQTAHDAIASLLGMDCAAPGDNDQDDAQRSDEPSPDAQPAPAVREDVLRLEELVPDLAARAAEVALGVVRQRTG